jgi:hypothetical protein
MQGSRQEMLPSWQEKACRAVGQPPRKAGWWLKKSLQAGHLA